MNLAYGLICFGIIAGTVGVIGLYLCWGRNQGYW